MKSILEKMKQIEHDGQNSSFQLSVKYTGEELVRGWPPALNSEINDKGIPDPGFGQGPVEYSQIDYILVHSEPVWRPLADARRDEHKQKFKTLAMAIGTLPNVEVTDEHIKIRNA